MSILKVRKPQNLKAESSSEVNSKAKMKVESSPEIWSDVA